MRDALDAPAVVAADGDDEALVSDRHQLVLNRLLRAAHQGFERARDGRAKAHDVCAYAREFGARAVVQLTARKYLRRDARREAHQRARQLRDRLPKHGRGLALRLHGGARVRSLLAQAREFEQHERFEYRAFDSQTRESLRRVFEFAERPAHAARAQLGALRDGAQRATHLFN